MRFHRAARRKRRRIEIEHHRSLLQRIGERKLEFLARERRQGVDIRSLRAVGQSGVSRGGGERQGERRDGGRGPGEWGNGWASHVGLRRDAGKSSPRGTAIIGQEAPSRRSEERRVGK